MDLDGKGKCPVENNFLVSKAGIFCSAPQKSRTSSVQRVLQPWNLCLTEEHFVLLHVYL